MRHPHRVEEVALRVAEHWLRMRRDLKGKVPTVLAAELDDIELATRGDRRRCSCVAGRDSQYRFHDIGCGAYLYEAR